MTTSLDAALLDVRKAYRLLADYQQRIIELLGFIRSEFGAVPYHQHWRNKPPQGFSPALEQSNDAGLRFLPLLDVSVLWILHFNKHEDYVHHHSSGDMLIDVQICSDAGIATHGDRTSEPVETSQSALAFTLYHCDDPAPAPFNWYGRVWQQMLEEYPEHGEVVVSETVPGYRMYRELLPLSALSDEQSVREEIAAFRRRAGEKLDREAQDIG
jgi:hypothetical protein